GMTMKSMKAWGLVFLAILVAGGCAETSSGSGSNSNWAKCTTSNACAAIVSGAYCSSGHCVDPREAGADGGALTCNERTSAIGAEVQRAVADADKSCTKDSDCNVFAPAGRCYESCSATTVSIAGHQAPQSTFA